MVNRRLENFKSYFWVIEIEGEYLLLVMEWENDSLHSVSALLSELLLPFPSGIKHGVLDCILIVSSI